MLKLYRIQDTFFNEASEQLLELGHPPTVERCQASLVLSFYCDERGWKYLRRQWLGITVNMAISMGIHRGGGSDEFASSQVSNSLWLAIYSLDR